MSKIATKKIGLLLGAGSNWIGGVIYVQNLINSFKFIPLNERLGLTVFIVGKIPPNFYEGIDKDVLESTTFEVIQTSLFYNFKKIAYYLLTGLYYKNNLIKPFAENEIDIAYPFHSSTKCETLKCIDWIPDFQHKHLPEMFSNREIKDRDRNYRHTAEYSDIVVLSSNDAKKDFDRFCPDQKFKSRVLSFASNIPNEIFDNDPIPIKKKYNLPDKFLLVANQFWKHKDHFTLFRAIHELKINGIDIPLVCTGELKDYRNKEYYKQIRDYITYNDLSSNIQILGFIPRSDQLQIMRLSSAIVQPSLFEGWSTVIEDGRALGKIMIISDIPVNIEQNPDNAIYFKAKSIESLANQLKNNWDKLAPGPDLNLEIHARLQSKERMEQFARTFIKIIDD